MSRTPKVCVAVDSVRRGKMWEDYVKVESPGVKEESVDDAVSDVAVITEPPSKTRAIPDISLDSYASIETRLARIEKLLGTLIELAQIGLLDVFRREKQDHAEKVSSAQNEVRGKEQGIALLKAEMARNNMHHDQQKQHVRNYFEHSPYSASGLDPRQSKILSEEEHPNNPVLRVQIDKLERELQELKFQRDILGEFSIADIYTSLNEFIDAGDGEN
jgi:hypothetical protein